MVLRHGRSEFGRRAEPERSEGGGARRSVAVPNGEGVASGSATRVLKKSCGISQKFKNLRVLRQSPCARKALCTTGRAGPLACAAAADHPAIHNPRPAAAQKKNLIKILDQKHLFFGYFDTNTPLYFSLSSLFLIALDK